MKNFVVVCCLHGTEPYGLEVARRLQPSVPFILGNEKALEFNQRFIETDLNRCFPGKINGTHEEKLAVSILEKIKEYDFVIDLHSSSNYCPLFGIITKPNKEKIDFAKSLGLKRLVIMSESFASGKAMIDFANCGISLEIGPHDGENNVSEVVEKINNFIEQKNKNEAIEIYEVISLVKKEFEEILINNFEEVKAGQVISKFENKIQRAEFDFTAVLVNEKSYGDVLCLACRKI